MVRAQRNHLPQVQVLGVHDEGGSKVGAGWRYRLAVKASAYRQRIAKPHYDGVQGANDRRLGRVVHACGRVPHHKRRTTAIGLQPQAPPRVPAENASSESHSCDRAWGNEGSSVEPPQGARVSRRLVANADSKRRHHQGQANLTPSHDPRVDLSTGGRGHLRAMASLLADRSGYAVPGATTVTAMADDRMWNGDFFCPNAAPSSNGSLR